MKKKHQKSFEWHIKTIYKIFKIIKSCKHYIHVSNAKKVLDLYLKNHKTKDNNILSEQNRLYKFFELKQQLLFTKEQFEF